MSGYQLIVKKPIELLAILIENFCGNANLALEGELSHQDFSQIPGTSKIPTNILVRNTIWPEQDFIIMPIEVGTKDLIKGKILSQVGLRTNVLHILLEKEGVLVFAAYDTFDPDSVWLSNKADKKLLEELREARIIGGYKKVD